MRMPLLVSFWNRLFPPSSIGAISKYCLPSFRSNLKDSWTPQIVLVVLGRAVDDRAAGMVVSCVIAYVPLSWARWCVVGRAGAVPNRHPPTRKSESGGDVSGGRPADQAIVGFPFLTTAVAMAVAVDGRSARKLMSCSITSSPLGSRPKGSSATLGIVTVDARSSWRGCHRRCPRRSCR